MRSFIRSRRYRRAGYFQYFLSNHSFPILLVAAAGLLLPSSARAQNDDCIPDPEDDSVLICSGNQAAGIDLTSNSVTHLRVGELDDPGIQPGPGDPSKASPKCS